MKNKEFNKENFEDSSEKTKIRNYSNFSKDEFKRAMKRQYYSKGDLIIKGKKVNFDNAKINGQPLSKLIYGDMPQQDIYLDAWESFNRYNR